MACYYRQPDEGSVPIMYVLISGCTFLANDAKVCLPFCKSPRNDASRWLQDGAHLRAINTALTVSHCQFISSVSHAVLSSISKTKFLTCCCLHYLYSLLIVGSTVFLPQALTKYSGRSMIHLQDAVARFEKCHIESAPVRISGLFFWSVTGLIMTDCVTGRSQVLTSWSHSHLYLPSFWKIPLSASLRVLRLFSLTMLLASERTHSLAMAASVPERRS